jgi:hypothetical protein
LYRFCAADGSDSDGVVLGVIVEEARGSGVGLASSCSDTVLTMDALGLSKGLYDGLDKGVSTLVARLVPNEIDVLHELGAGLPAREVRLGVVGVGN